MFVLAAGAVGAGASAEFDLAFVEVFDEVVPLGVGDVAVLLGGPQFASFLEVGLVVADDIVVEDGDVATEGFEVEMPQERGADVDGQSAVGQLGSERRKSCGVKCRPRNAGFESASSWHACLIQVRTAVRPTDAIPGCRMKARSGVRCGLSGAGLSTPSTNHLRRLATDWVRRRAML
ncbi:hypothetical protein [Nocardia gipuzkoensis]|uniref:hypothetical protein n=1 Tax=Nocardia gipuzkoensis TaxID=2749991 RepID=UPI0015EF3258|nr:hypothetical protein [Nocardia gipuzkoensis]